MAGAHEVLSAKSRRADREESHPASLPPGSRISLAAGLSGVSSAVMYRSLTLACTCCLLSCGGIVEYSENNVRDEPASEDGDSNIDNDSGTEDLEPPPNCSGTFAEAQVMFEDPGWISQAIAPSANGLEFFYARLAMDPTLDDSGTRLPTLRTRTTVDSDFGEPVILWELSTACSSVRPGTELAALDLSHDGLRLYIGCSTFEHAVGATGPLVVVERSNLSSTFELPPRVIGEVGISLGLTRDELTAYGTTLDPTIDQVLWYKRDSIEDSFGPARIAAGAVSMFNPEPSPDGQELWGVVQVKGTTTKRVAISNWNAQLREYEAPREIALPPPENSSDVSPALTGDCRSLYFSRYTFSPQVTSKIMIARR